MEFRKENNMNYNTDLEDLDLITEINNPLGRLYEDLRLCSEPIDLPEKQNKKPLKMEELEKTADNLNQYWK